MASQRTSTILAASGFDSSASVAGAGVRDGDGRAVVKLRQQRVWRARRSESRADDDFMPGFDSDGSEFGSEGGSGSGLMANGVRRNGPSMSSAPQPVGNQKPRGGSKLMIGLIGRVVATVEAVGVVSLTLRYLRIYSIWGTDASISELCTEFTSV
jgi:hypothetical protein